jgi:hypothetical protein
VKKGGTYATLAANQPGAAGIALSKNGRRMAFTTTVNPPGTFEITASGLNIWGPRGKRVYADTLAYEQAKNPDKINTYGPRSTDPCVTGVLGPAGPGGIDSHAYSVTAWKGGWVVADAGANALLWVGNKGRIKTLAVLPPQPYVVTAEAAASEGMPTCVVGTTYDFEPVPTDVEVGKDGYLYVTTLPGGPESSVFGARGKVWRVNPHTGRARVVAQGLLGATNLALGKGRRGGALADQGRLPCAPAAPGVRGAASPGGSRSRRWIHHPRPIVSAGGDQRQQEPTEREGDECGDQSPVVDAGEVVQQHGAGQQPEVAQDAGGEQPGPSLPERARGCAG